MDAWVVTLVGPEGVIHRTVLPHRRDGLCATGIDHELIVGKHEGVGDGRGPQADMPIRLRGVEGKLSRPLNRYCRSGVRRGRCHGRARRCRLLRLVILGLRAGGERQNGSGHKDHQPLGHDALLACVN